MASTSSMSTENVALDNLDPPMEKESNPLDSDAHMALIAPQGEIENFQSEVVDNYMDAKEQENNSKGKSATVAAKDTDQKGKDVVDLIDTKPTSSSQLTKSNSVSSAGSNEIDEKLIAEEYKVWKKNTPFLYDLVMTSALEWPSLTVEWLPSSNTLSTANDDNDNVATGNDITSSSSSGGGGSKEKNDKNSMFDTHKLLLGTHTSGSEQNYLMVANIQLPNENHEIDARKYDDERKEVGGFGSHHGSKFEIKVKIKHDGEVNRARYMPQNPFVVATKSPTSNVYVFDISKHPSEPREMDPFKVEHICKGHTREGYGLCWNYVYEGHLLSGSDDALVCLWDITNAKQEVQPKGIYRGHEAVVEDVSFHYTNGNLFASVGDDLRLCTWDARKPPSSGTITTVKNAHKSFINCVEFAPLDEYILATGSADQTVGIWDLRNLKQPISVLEGHQDEIYQLKFAPFCESILASCGSDRRVNVWDLSKIGMEQDAEEAEDGPPELLFVHGGHTSKVSDLAWNNDDPFVIASVAEDNILQVWQIADSIIDDAEEGDIDEPLTEDMLEGSC